MRLLMSVINELGDISLQLQSKAEYSTERIIT